MKSYKKLRSARLKYEGGLMMKGNWIWQLNQITNAQFVFIILPNIHRELDQRVVTRRRHAITDCQTELDITNLLLHLLCIWMLISINRVNESVHVILPEGWRSYTLTICTINIILALGKQSIHCRARPWNDMDSEWTLIVILQSLLQLFELTLLLLFS